MAKRLIASTFKFYEERLFVYYLDKVSSTKDIICRDYNLGTWKDYEYDLTIIIEIRDKEEGFFAAAAPCYREPWNYRTIVGIFFLNLDNLASSSKLRERLLFSTFAHEIGHILGFSSSKYDDFPVDGESSTNTDRIPEEDVLTGK